MPLRFLIRLLALASLVTPVAAQSPDAQPLSQCEVIARVNSEVILACDLDWQIRLRFESKFGRDSAEKLVKSPLFAQAREELTKQLIMSQIEMSLLYGDFLSNAPQADMQAIQRQLNQPFEEQEVPRLMKMLSVEDRSALEVRLRELGTSLRERRQAFYRTMVARSWLTESISFDREVTHEQMLENYQEHLEEYQQPDRARWEELFIAFDRHASKREAFAALANLGNRAYEAATNQTADQPAFADLARQYSDGYNADEGGLYDWTTRGSLVAEQVDKAIFEQAIGQMSPTILEGPSGFHIVRVIERIEAGPTPFSEVQAEIRKNLRDERFQVAINERLTEMKKSARIWTKFTGEVDYEELAKRMQPTMQR